MIQKFSFLPLLLVAFAGMGQEITVSQEIPLKNATSYELIGKLKDRFLLLQDRPTEVEVQGFNEALQQVWLKELELDKRQPKVLSVIRAKDEFTVIYRYRRKGKTIVKAHRYDAAANLRDSVMIKDYGTLFFTPDFEIIRSEDRSKICIYHIEKIKNLRAVAYDIETMEVLWDEVISPPDMDFNLEFMQAMLNNDGDFAFVLNKDNFRSKRKDHHYEVHEFRVAGTGWEIRRINLEDRLTYDVFFDYDNLNGGFVAGGLYSEKNLARANGFFYLNQPADQSDYLLRFEEFDKEFVGNLAGKEIDKNKGIVEVTVQDIVLRRDGGILMIGEKNRQLERRSIAGSGRLYYDPSRRFLVDYYFDELFVISIHPDGKLHWKTILPKKQFSQDDNGIYSSFFLFKTPSSLKFLFNDEIKNENTVSEYNLRGNGEFDRNSILNTQNLELKLRFRDAVQISNNEILVPSEKKNRVKMVILEY